MNFNKSLSVSLFFSLFSLMLVADTFGQERQRIIQNSSYAEATDLQQTSETQDLPKPHRKATATLTNQIVLVQTAQPLVKKTVSSLPIKSATTNYAAKTSYSAFFSNRLLGAIQTRLGIPYLYGSDGPTRYDCSGLVWSVFREAGYTFERTSARNIWYASETVEGTDRFKFGTLVFFKGLGHMGIVADENGFYHASSSKGVTYSRFDGYWGKLITGFRRMKADNLVAVK